MALKWSKSILKFRETSWFPFVSYLLLLMPAKSQSSHSHRCTINLNKQLVFNVYSSPIFLLCLDLQNSKNKKKRVKKNEVSFKFIYICTIEISRIKKTKKNKQKIVSENNCEVGNKVRERRQNRLRSGASTRWAIKQLKLKRESRKFTLTPTSRIVKFSRLIKSVKKRRINFQFVVVVHACLLHKFFKYSPLSPAITLDQFWPDDSLLHALTATLFLMSYCFLVRLWSSFVCMTFSYLYLFVNNNYTFSPPTPTHWVTHWRFPERYASLSARETYLFNYT